MISCEEAQYLVIVDSLQPNPLPVSRHRNEGRETHRKDNTVNRFQYDLRNFRASLVVCVVLTGSSVLCADSDLATAAKNVKQVIAHRGASAERPECTLVSIRRAIEVGATAVEVDVRTSRDGQLFILHDRTLDRTTNGSGPASELTLAELQKLDAGSSFDPAYRNERIPSLIQVAQACRGEIELLLDLKEQGDDYDRQVATVIRQHGDPMQTIIGVRSVVQAERFRRLLPQARQLALIPSVESIEGFAKAGVDTIRLWPGWLRKNDRLAQRVHSTGKQLHLNGTMGELDETIELLAFRPSSLLSDHPARLLDSLKSIVRDGDSSDSLRSMIEKADGAPLKPGDSQVGARTFLNRDYLMLEIPKEISGLPRYAFNGGDGAQVRLQFRQQAVVFAVFEYNSTGSWSFPDSRSPEEHGWHQWRTRTYRGSSNPGSDEKPNRASIWFREFQPNQQLAGLPAWWLCLGITDLETAGTIDGFKAGLISNVRPPVLRYSHAAAAAEHRPLHIPDFESVDSFRQWQTRQRAQFVDRFLYQYTGDVTISEGEETQHETHHRREFHVTLDGQRLFRFFRLEPRSSASTELLPTIVCFMGHGKIAQILDDDNSYQHACADVFAKAGFLVYAMENIGMDSGRDTHLDLDQSLRLEGHGWYSLLFAHQRITLDHVFADGQVDANNVGVAGVSTGGLLALSAAVMEPRISAVSVQGIFGSMRTSFIRDRNRHCRCGAIPGLLPEFDLPELALLVAPRALHVSNGRTDGFSPEESERCVNLIAPLYQWAGGQKPVFTVSPGGHEFTLEPARTFFTTQLRPSS